MWLASHERLMTMSQRRRLDFYSSDTCPSCFIVVEDTLHILCDCRQANPYWQIWFRKVVGVVPMNRHNILGCRPTCQKVIILQKIWSDDPFLCSLVGDYGSGETFMFFNQQSSSRSAG
ncbi:hypothetical protein Droror1_Dr00012575 [Drosera rotundifolia]